jgi:putative transcriptional regulator
MITNRLSEIAGKKRFRIAEISRLSGISYSIVQRLYNDKVKSIEFENLDKLCLILECTPNELLGFESK